MSVSPAPLSVPEAPPGPIVRLDLNDRGLTQWPPEVYAHADTLEVLNLSGNALSTLPDDLPRLHRLRVIFVSDNPFTELPEVLGRCPSLEVVGFKACRIERVSGAALPPNLRWLILTDNRISSLPDELGRRPALQKLMLAGNRLSTLPDTLADAHRLELLRLSANRFERLPDWLAELPALTWLATSGNPFSLEVERAALLRAQHPTVPDHHLHTEAQLGEGASGVIHRARWTPDPVTASDRTVAVAVKRFKGAMTSDGLPESEMAACLAAGPHPGLIRVLGRTLARPEDAPTTPCGLVLELIDPAFQVLAGPPSLHSCTRDVYPAPLSLDSTTALQLARTLASVTTHLHAQGLVHGDLYAHNILWRPDTGAALLGDFGAASFHAAAGPHLAWALQAMEVRALGVLMTELLARIPPTSAGPTPTEQHLALWATQCLDPLPARRPTAASLHHHLLAAQNTGARPT